MTSLATPHLQYYAQGRKEDIEANKNITNFKPFENTFK
jgi:hypothetical protein